MFEEMVVQIQGILGTSITCSGTWKSNCLRTSTSWSTIYGTGSSKVGKEAKSTICCTVRRCTRACGPDTADSWSGRTPPGSSSKLKSSGWCVCGGGGGGADLCVAHECLSSRAHSCKLIETDRRQCASPFGWTEQPAKALCLLPPSAGSRRPRVQNLTQLQVEEKDCEARPPHSPLLRRKGGAIFSISPALDALDPE